MNSSHIQTFYQTSLDASAVSTIFSSTIAPSFYFACCMFDCVQSPCIRPTIIYILNERTGHVVSTTTGLECYNKLFSRGLHNSAEKKATATILHLKTLQMLRYLAIFQPHVSKPVLSQGKLSISVWIGPSHQVIIWKLSLMALTHYT